MKFLFGLVLLFVFLDVSISTMLVVHSQRNMSHLTLNFKKGRVCAFGKVSGYSCREFFVYSFKN